VRFNQATLTVSGKQAGRRCRHRVDQTGLNGRKGEREREKQLALAAAAATYN
jgi:hypothetical protein